MTIRKHNIINYLIALVWFINGFFCKLLNLVPRHQLIVARISGSNYSGLFTKAIGVAEILMAIWIINGYKSRLNAITQIIVIAAMNMLEFILVPDLLLWGKMNLVFALILIGIIYYNEFVLTAKPLK